MGLIHIMERGGDDYRDYKKALKKAKESAYDMKEAIEVLCSLTEDMEEQYSERGSRMRRKHEEWDEPEYRRMR